MERYYNFGGEGVRAARAMGVPLVLEVNAPVVDYPGSPKHVLDRALLVEPMRRWRDWQCAAAALIVTPSAAILPARCRAIGSSRSSGAPTRSGFARARPGPSPFIRRAGQTLVGVCRRVPRVARRHPSGRGDPARFARAGARTSRRC